MKKNFVSWVLVFVLILGLFTPFSDSIYGATSPNFSFDWYEDKTIKKDILDINNRAETENEMVLGWTYKKEIGGTNDYSGNYVLSYNLTDEERMEITVNNKVDNTAQIKYRVKQLNSDGKVVSEKNASLKVYDENDSKLYWVYDEKENNWHNETSTGQKWQNSITNGEQLPDNIFATTGIVLEMKNNATDGVGPNISLKQGTSIAFKYDENLIVIKLDQTGQNILLGIDKVRRNNIYKFNLTDDKKRSQHINVLNLADFDINPVPSPNIIIDKKQNPTEYPGQKPVGLKVKVALPQVWDNVSKYVYNKFSDGDYEGLEAVINLEASSSGVGEKIQIRIPDIYDGSQSPIVNDPTSTNAKIDYSTVKVEDGYYNFEIKDLESSTFYRVSTIKMAANLKPSASANAENTFKTKSSNLPGGKHAYTYIEYNSETKGTGERVLKIKPYNNITGEYYIHKDTVKNLNLGDSEQTRISRFSYSLSDGATIKEMPISNSGDNYYRIEFKSEAETVKSQILLDNPDKSAYLITPKLEVKNYKVINETVTEGDTVKINQKLKLQLSWSAGNKGVFDALVSGNKKVTYDFVKTPFSPRDEDANSTITKYAEFLKLDVGADYKLTLNETGGPWNVNKEKIDSRYVFKPISDNQEDLELVFTVDLEFELVSEADLASRDEPSKIFYYPSVYYIKMKGNYINVMGEQKDTPYCNPVNITLDEKSNVVLPPPQGIAINTVTSKSFNLNWSTVSDSVYKDFLETNNYTLEKENGVGVNIFITQKNVLDEKDAEKQLSYFKDGVIDVPFANVVTETTKDLITVDLSSLIDSIRTNKMIRITDVPQIQDLKVQVVNIKGLDRNTIYYTALQTVLNVISNVDGTKKKEISNSISQILTVTTKKEDDLLPPKPEEVPPQAPIDFRKDAEVEQLPTIITLTWTDVKEPQSINGVNVKKEYEIIRVDKKLDNSLLSKRNSFDDFWANDLKSAEIEKFGWQTLSSKPQPENLLMYDNNDFRLDTTKTSGRYIYEYANSPKLQFIDKTPMPNRLYYYYIRTVRMSETTTGTYSESSWSSWIPASVTTSPVQSPVGLKLERNETYFTYNTEKEIIISFFAPIPTGTTFAQIASLYPLEYSIMEENGKWVTATMDINNASLFKEGNEKKEGYRQFVYKITGLTPGKGYSVKVRMKARVNPITEPTPIYDVSLDSNTVEFRTELNQEDYDTDESTKKWLKKFDEEVLALSSKNYWLFTNSANAYEAVYRTKTFEGELQKATSGAYEFETNNQKKQTYYIPAGVISISDTSNIGFRAKKDGMDILIRPSSFDSSTSEAVATALNKIKDGSVKDYYIKIVLDWNKSNETVNNSQALTEQVQVKVSTVGSKELEKTLDAQFVQMFNKAIADAETVEARVRNRLKKDLKVEIKAGASDEELYKLVMDAVDEVYGDLIADIEDSFNSNTKSNYAVDSLAENMLITATVNTQSTVAGYRKNNTTWETINTRDYSGKKGFETKLIGTFVFAGRIINIPDITGVANSTLVKELIAKYGLDDYLGKDIINSASPATKNMVVGSIARMAGALPTQNEVAFLKSKGVDVNASKLYDQISNQETLYLIMSLYEIKTGTKVSTIRITNYNLMPSSSSADDKYKKSVQVAAQLGIWTDTSVLPKSSITIKTLLEYLGNISTKIKM